MKKGIVKFFNHSKGFGFIRDEESGNEYYVHEKKCIDAIKDKDAVTFELEEAKRGQQCINVRLL